MHASRSVTLISSLVLALSLFAFAHTGAWGEDQPNFAADITHDAVDGRDFALNASVTVEVREAPGGDLLLSEGVPTDGSGYFEQWFEQDLAPGMEVTVSDGTSTKVLVLVSLSVDAVDLGSDAVSGTAPGSSSAHVNADDEEGWGDLDVAVEPDGAWSADFAGVYDIVWSTQVSVDVSDEDGDVTRASMLRPRFSAEIRNNGVQGWEFTPNGPVTIEVRDAPGGDVIGSTTADADAHGNFDFDLEVDVSPGVEITVSDGVHTKVLVVGSLSIDELDFDADTISGTGPANSQVHVWGESWDWNSGADRWATADVDGRWVADFAGELDLDSGTTTHVSVSDGDGDETRLDRYPPGIEGDLRYDNLGGWDFLPDASVTIEIREAPGGEVVFSTTRGVDPEGGIDSELPVDLVPGMEVSVSDGHSTKVLVLADLVIEGFDLAADTVWGTGPADSQVQVWAEPWDYSNWGETWVTSDETGAWTADLSEMIDIGFSFEVGAKVRDPDGDFTANILSTPEAPSVVLHPGGALPGWVVGVTGGSFGPEEAVSVTLDGAEVANVTTDADGAFDTTFTVPDGTTAEEHTVTATGSSSGTTADAVLVVLAPAGSNVFRTAVADLGVNADLDPSGEYSLAGFGLHGQMLVRTLVTYPHVGGPGGNELVPDLATDLGVVSDGGLTYTFTLKDGVRFGPPLDRAITSEDVGYAIDRVRTGQFGGYPFYYDVISEIETPDARTIVFHLTEPTGDFPYLLAMPAAGPIPEEVAGCFEGYAEYGRYLVSSGPYMIRGADEVDASSCGALSPTAGWQPGSLLELVRNPSYDPSTDSPEARENNIDGLRMIIGMDRQDIFDRIRSGELDGSLVDVPPPDVVDEYLTNPDLAGLLHMHPGDRVTYLSMNLLVPPFDDVNVRRAVNLILDKAALQQTWGGSAYGEIATNVFPPGILPATSGYDPYPDHDGDLDAARAAMASSAYDTDGDGMCDDPACQGVVMVATDEDPTAAGAAVIEESLARIGIVVDVRFELDRGEMYATIGEASNLIPLAADPGWGKDYQDPYNFAQLFHSDFIRCGGGFTYNYSLLGMSEYQATECGIHDAWEQAPPPSVDAAIEACQVLFGDDRSACWVGLNERLMEEIVPWAPYRLATDVTVVGARVRDYEFDRFGEMISLVHISLESEPEPQEQVQQVVDALDAMVPTGDAGADKVIGKVMDRLEDALDPALWVDPTHLGTKGGQAFTGLQQAVHELMKVASIDGVDEQIAAVVAAARAVAQTAIDEAAAAGGDALWLAKAEASMAKAESLASGGDFDKAVTEFGKAWGFAGKSLG